MEFIFCEAQTEEINEIMSLYSDVIKTTFTTWDENYPSRNQVENDIKIENLFVLKNDGKIVAVSFLGGKGTDDEVWQIDLKQPQRIARICVSHKLQGKGVGTFFVKKLIEKAKQRGADGMHFHVCTQNPSAMKMYEKAGFKNCGQGKSNYGFDFFKFEQKFN